MRSIKNRTAKSTLVPGYLFNSRYEERMTLRYLVNIIESKFINLRPEEILRFAYEVIGNELLLAYLKRKKMESAKLKEVKESGLDVSSVIRTIGVNIGIMFMKTAVLPYLKTRIEELAAMDISETEKRLSHLQEMFGLTDLEVDYLGFLYILRIVSPVNSALGNRNSIIDYETAASLVSYGHIPLGISTIDFRRVVSSRRLLDVQLISASGSGLESWLYDFLSGAGGIESASELFFKYDNMSTFNLDDCQVHDNDMNIIDLVVRSNKPFNLLLYGYPGTGKTSFARSLARKYGKKLAVVKNANDDNHRALLRNITATLNSVGDDTITLIDEADETLNTCSSSYFQIRNDKGWINRLLDGHMKKVIWITNRTGQIDPSTMRRFSYTVEFTAISEERKKKMLRCAISRASYGDVITDEDVQKLCDAYSFNADGVAKIISMLDMCQDMPKAEAIRTIEAVLENHEKNTHMRRARAKERKNRSEYAIDILNCSIDINQVVKTARQYVNLTHSATTKPDLSALSMLLHGQPGTGKTEFVIHLGKILDISVMTRRASDIMSKYIGETESNIAEAFRTARNDKVILFFDEADTFLFPRSKAERSWERSFTNELLTQMESFQGIVVFATNDVGEIDHAAMRRFKFKIEFKTLSSLGKISLYKQMLSPLVHGGSPLTPDEEHILENIPSLTPGDYALLKDRFGFLPPKGLTHSQLISELAGEVSYKKQSCKKAIGF